MNKEVKTNIVIELHRFDCLPEIPKFDDKYWHDHTKFYANGEEYYIKWTEPFFTLKRDITDQGVMFSSIEIRKRVPNNTLELYFYVLNDIIFRIKQ